MKRITAVLLLLALCLASLVPGMSEENWTCGSCGSVNIGNFCVKCGQPRVSPTPLPTAEPTPEPTAEPEIWQCRHCFGDNAKDNAYCRFCGSPRPGADTEFFSDPVGPLYKGMTEKEVIEASGGTLIRSIWLGSYELFADYKYDSWGGLERVDLSVNNSYISHSAFVRLIRDMYGADGWSGESHFDFGGGMSADHMNKEYDGVKVTIWYVNDFMNILRIEPQLQWSNIQTGRESVSAQRGEE